jgi:hypothetical protein
MDGEPNTLPHEPRSSNSGATVRSTPGKSWRPEWWKNPSDRFAFLIAFFTAALSGVAYLQYLAMSNTDRAIHSQLEVMEKQLEAMRNTDGTIHDQLKIMQRQLETMNRDQMPLLFIKPDASPRFELTDAGKNRGDIRWNIYISNTGKTDAVNIRMKKFLSLGEGGAFLSEGNELTIETMVAGSDYFVTIYSPELSSVQAAALLKKNHGVNALVELSYDDVIGGSHSYAFCASTSESGAIELPHVQDCQKEKAK